MALFWYATNKPLEHNPAADCYARAWENPPVVIIGAGPVGQRVAAEFLQQSLQRPAPVFLFGDEPRTGVAGTATVTGNCLAGFWPAREGAAGTDCRCRRNVGRQAVRAGLSFKSRSKGDMHGQAENSCECPVSQ
jgi:hypothetical protein